MVTWIPLRMLLLLSWWWSAPVCASHIASQLLHHLSRLYLATAWGKTGSPDRERRAGPFESRLKQTAAVYCTLAGPWWPAGEYMCWMWGRKNIHHWSIICTSSILGAVSRASPEASQFSHVLQPSFYSDIQITMQTTMSTEAFQLLFFSSTQLLPRPWNSERWSGHSVTTSSTHTMQTYPCILMVFLHFWVLLALVSIIWRKQMKSTLQIEATF